MAVAVTLDGNKLMIDFSTTKHDILQHEQDDAKKQEVALLGECLLN